MIRSLLAALSLIVLALAPALAAQGVTADRLIGPGDDIAAAFAQAEAGETLVVQGHHRVTEALPLRDDQTVFLDGATIDGSVLLDPAGWTRSGQTWRQAIPDAEGSGHCDCKRPQNYIDKKKNPLAGEREKLLVDGTFIFEVAKGRGTPDGSAKWWRHEDGAAVINFDPKGHVIEVTHAEQIFAGKADNVRILGASPERAVIRGAASPLHRGMIEGRGTVGWTVDGVTVEDSASVGLRLKCGLIRNAVIRENGQIGVTGSGGRCRWPEGAAHGKWFNSVVDSEIYRNNLALFREEWAAGGVKLGLRIKACRVAGNRVWGNLGTALWVDNRGGGSCVFEDNLIWANARSGLHAEYQAKQPGFDYAFLARNNIVVNNSPKKGWKVNRAAAMVRRQPDAAFIGNVFVQAGGGNFLGIKQNEASARSDDWVSRNTVFRDNVVVFLRDSVGVGGLLIQKVEGALEDLNAAIDGNLYVMPKGQEDRPRWWLETASGGGDRGWSGWQSAGYDRNGSRLSVDDPVAWLRQHHPKAAALLN